MWHYHLRGSGDVSGQNRNNPQTRPDRYRSGDGMHGFTGLAQDLLSLARSVTAQPDANNDARRSHSYFRGQQDIFPQLAPRPRSSRNEFDRNETGIGGQQEIECAWVDSLSDECRHKLAWEVGHWQVVPTLALEGEMIFATDATVNRSYVLYLRESESTRNDQILITGQSTSVGLQISGPQIGVFETGGLILFDFHGSPPAAGEAGAYFLRGYGELRNDRWRIAFGQMEDLIAPRNAATVNWTGLQALGNIGNNQRGMFRLERYFHSGPSTRWALQGAISQPIVTDFADNPSVLGRDNGLPNFEGRIGLELGNDGGCGRPFELGISGMYGQTLAGPGQGFPAPTTSDAFAIVTDLQWSLNRLGFQGELFHGAALGTYLGGIGQSLNLVTGDAIRSSGGWGQLSYQVRPRVTLSGIFGMDNPRDIDLSGGQRSNNRVIGGNIFWDVNQSLRIGLDVWQVHTSYVAPDQGNQATVLMFETRLSF